MYKDNVYTEAIVCLQWHIMLIKLIKLIHSIRLHTKINLHENKIHMTHDINRPKSELKCADTVLFETKATKMYAVTIRES